MKVAGLILISYCYGLLAAAGVFTVFLAVSLVPRFAGRTSTKRYVVLYEEMVVLGTLLGGGVSLFLWDNYTFSFSVVLVDVVEILFGLFAGIFVGSLALAIAEMLNSIPIFTRRVGLQGGIGLAVLCMAAGKLCGPFLFFYYRIGPLTQG